jgi:ligand-binding SRPBCC domain-containing protein
MFEIVDSAVVAAGRERCFLLATSIALVEQTIGLKPVEGKTAGLVEGGDRLVWRGWKFGLPAMHETLITQYDRPGFFEDTMGRGRFAFFQHGHWFEEGAGGTVMRDVVRFQLPLGWAGWLVAKWIVVPHVRGLVKRRFALLKRMAETDEGDRYLEGAHPTA